MDMWERMEEGTEKEEMYLIHIISCEGQWKKVLEEADRSNVEQTMIQSEASQDSAVSGYDSGTILCRNQVSIGEDSFCDGPTQPGA